VPSYALFLLGGVVQGAAVGWGLFVQHRRQLALSQRDRAARAETEARLRAEQAQDHAGPRSPARCTTSSATACPC
jgi:hypothetical protein